MSDYSSLKVPELKKLLAEKKLPQTGNKADLISRLREDDRKSGSSSAQDKSDVRQSDKAPPVNEGGSSSPAAVAAVSKPTPQPVPDHAARTAPKEDAKPANQAADKTSAPETTRPVPADESAEVEGGDKRTAPAAPTENFAIGLSASSADDELKKRADRAKRFGIGEDDETKKRADRAKRFGIDENLLSSSLDSALPERPLKRGRAGAGEDGNRGGKRRGFDRGPGPGRDRRDPRSNGTGHPSGRLGNVLDDPSERSKADKRAARFAAAY